MEPVSEPEKLGPEKKYRKNLLPEKSTGIATGTKKFPGNWSRKSIGTVKIWTRKKVPVLVPEKFWVPSHSDPHYRTPYTPNGPYKATTVGLFRHDHIHHVHVYHV